MSQGMGTTCSHAELLRVEGLTKHFPIGGNWLRKPAGFIHAVDGVSFTLEPGGSLGLVGESGCGKTTIGKLLVKLIEPTTGTILFRKDASGYEDVTELKGRNLKAFRRRSQMIFQDPYESMNPRRTIYDTIAEPLVVQGIGTEANRMDRVSRILHLVGLSPPESFLLRYPHELSGGQRQRVAIARALVIEPSFVVADEPTSMLDVSVRTGIMNLMGDLAQELDVSYLYVTHDLAVARYMCQRIAVMYSGKIVELAETEELLSNPQHPYTQALLAAVPQPTPGVPRKPANILGEITAPIDPPDRCRFYERCPLADKHCRDNPHPDEEMKTQDHMVACYKV